MTNSAKTALVLTLAIVGGIAAGMRCDASEWVENSSQTNPRPAAYTVKAYTGGSYTEGSDPSVLRGIMNKELTNNDETGWLFRGLAIGCCLFFVIISFVLDCIIGVGRTAGLGCVSPLMGPFALLFGNFLRYCGFVYWLIALFFVFAPVFIGWLLRRHQLIRELLFFIFVVLWNLAGFLGLFLCMER